MDQKSQGLKVRFPLTAINVIQSQEYVLFNHIENELNGKKNYMPHCFTLVYIKQAHTEYFITSTLHRARETKKLEHNPIWVSV
jgi:hypothetical protein